MWRFGLSCDFLGQVVLVAAESNIEECTEIDFLLSFLVPRGTSDPVALGLQRCIPKRRGGRTRPPAWWPRTHPELYRRPTEALCKPVALADPKDVQHLGGDADVQTSRLECGVSGD